MTNTAATSDMANLSDSKVRLVIFIFIDFKITLKVTRNHAKAVQWHVHAWMGCTFSVLHQEMGKIQTAFFGPYFLFSCSAQSCRRSSGIVYIDRLIKRSHVVLTDLPPSCTTGVTQLWAPLLCYANITGTAASCSWREGKRYGLQISMLSGKSAR